MHPMFFEKNPFTLELSKALLKAACTGDRHRNCHLIESPYASMTMNNGGNTQQIRISPVELGRNCKGKYY